jgi:hypothetical protein
MFIESTQELRPIVLRLFSDLLVMQGTGSHSQYTERLQLSRLLAIYGDTPSLERVLSGSSGSELQSLSPQACMFDLW